MADRRASEELQPSEKKGYIREQIVQPKSKPFRTVREVCVGLLFVLCAGAAAGASFAFVNHWIGNASETEESGQTNPSHSISYNPEDKTEEETDDVSKPEATLTSSEAESEPEESVSDSEAWIEAYLESREFSLREIEMLNDVLYQIYQKIQSSIFTLEVVRAEDELSTLTEERKETFGILVSKTQTEAILLADGNLFAHDAVLSVTVDNEQREVQIRQKDEITGIAALAMPLEGISESSLQRMQPVVIGDSYGVRIGETILFAGSPMGFPGSVQYGYISYVQKNVSAIDGEYRIFYTDSMAVSGSGGAMFNTQGELIGWMDTSSDTQHDNEMQRAIGISDLKYIIEDVISGINTAYIGVKVSTVTESIASGYGLPAGVYVTEVLPMSPAYEAGIQPGDVITNIQSASITDIAGFRKIISVLKENSEISIVLQRRGRDGYKERTIVLDAGSR